MDDQVYAKIERLQIEIEQYRIKCSRFIDAARQLMECEEQRQAHQDLHKELFKDDLWIPPRRALYQRSIVSVGELLRGGDSTV